jgi:OPA family sugar phosphate sensor protein UhpC-like MFS transporter
MGLFSRIRNFYAISEPIEQSDDISTPSGQKRYRRLAMQSFVAATIGYSLYYVCRTSLNVMKKPIIDSGFLDAAELGIIGSALLFAYAIGKFINGFMCDYCNIKRFMMTGLTISLLANLAMGILGFVGSAIPTFAILVIFATLWGINGWSQSMGSPPAIISLSRWFPLSRRGTFYGIFSASHNLGEFFSFLFVGNIVLAFGWQWGFVGSSIAGVIGVILIYFWLHDTPQSMGLPAIEAISNEQKASTEQTSQLQRQVLTNPAVWVLAAASAFMYVSRYAINSWGVLYLEEAKGFSNIDAVWIISINAL